MKIRMWRRKGPKRFLVLLIAPALVAMACQSGSGSGIVTGLPLSEALRSDAFCVERQSTDSRNLAIQIGESLRRAGLRVKTVKTGQCQNESSYRIVYVDSWFWLSPAFLSRMTIEVIDPSNDEILAYGESNQAAGLPGRMPHRSVIDRAVRTLLRSE